MATKPPVLSMKFIPDTVKLNAEAIERIRDDLYGDEKSGEIGICKKVNQMYRSWMISTVILKYVFPIVSAVIITLLGIVIARIFGG